MSLCVFASAKGAPGVTTSVLAVAAVWPAGRRVLVVECDPDGGDVAAWYRLATSPGLVECAAHGRQQLTASTVTNHAQQLPTAGQSDGDGDGGVGVVVAPPSAEQATAAVAAVAAGGAGRVFAAMDGVDVLVDVGRLRPDSPALPLVAHAATTVVVVRPEVAQVAHAAPRIANLSASARPVLLAIGDRPHAPGEVADALGVPVIGVLADDPRAAAALVGQGSARVVRRSGLLRSAAAVADRLAAHMTGPSDDDRMSAAETVPASVDAGGRW